MKKGKTLKTVFLVLLILAFIIFLTFIVLVIALILPHEDIVDYKGEYVNSSGDIFNIEIRTDAACFNPKSQLFLTDKNDRTVSYGVDFIEPEQALPSDVYFIDIDDDSFMTWVYDSNGDEIIFYDKKGSDVNNWVSERFYLDSEIRYVSDYEIYAINEIEQSKALDGLPDADVRKSKWDYYFTKMKCIYENSNTSSKEDSV